MSLDKPIKREHKESSKNSGNPVQDNLYSTPLHVLTGNANKRINVHPLVTEQPP
ncbi:hypothetical protein T440DRAFT_472792 [Plenodomus tracheiphilus IPT5]|uniref:Uncharacterized protein n=1 Tax=Plenodomus tracheiphilus IPT5 TaxID=1408161 RepID=A0A6A7APR0_9PLEO|nr:hypothetical protein T440DRAFT_473468 [Plenodomus tracheiphilus IPT5]KAF2845290.1 hypothetical protein T440DRAFT_472792 [Plenodomus tracheiphilus IPT5]